MKKQIVTILTVITLLSVVPITAATAAQKKPPEVSSDGLHLIPNTKVWAAYGNPDVALDKYSKVMILDCYVDFVKDWVHDYNLNEVGLAGRVSDKDADEIKKRLADEFKKVFTKVMTDEGYAVVDDVGPDVLLLRPALVNVDVTAPDLRTSGFNRTLINSAGGMTLFLELYDSASSTLLVRVLDPQADNTGFAQTANRVTNKAAADRILRNWAELLAKHLGEVKQQTKGQ